MRFQEVLDEYRIRYQTEGKYARSGWIQFHCPFCSGGKDPNKPYAGYNIAFNYVNCWRCGPHRVGDTIQELTGLSWRDVKSILSNLETERAPRKTSKVRRGKLDLPKKVGPMLPAHKQYLRDRGFDPAVIERLWNVQGIGMAKNLAWRLFIPIYYCGEVCSWTTRTISETRPDRYISASEGQEVYSHKDLLYGLDYCRHTVVVVEGPTDVWRVGPGAVATLGTGWSRRQLNLLSRFTRRVVCYDNEPAGQRRANELCDLLAVFPGETHNVRLDAKDPGSASKKEIRQLRKMFLGA